MTDQPNPKFANKRFLIVDDFESIRIMMNADLQSMGITDITQASSGNMAYKKIEESLAANTPFDFVISDLMMNDGNGLELVKLIRANSNLKKLPILMVTSESEVNLILACVQAGANNYVVKPWKKEDLAKKIESFLL